QPLLQGSGETHGRNRIETITGERFMNVDLTGLDCEPLGNMGNQPLLDFFSRSRSQVYTFPLNGVAWGIPLLPCADDLEAPVKESGFAGPALDFSAGCFGNGAGLEQHPGVKFEIVLFGNRLAHGAHDRVDIQPSEIGPFDLLNDDQALLTADLDRECGTACWTQCAVAFLHGQFNILRVVIQSPDDNHVLEAAGYKEITIFQESQITCGRERPLAGVCQVSLECLPRLFGPVPVPMSQGRPRNPDFADFVRLTLNRSLRIYNDGPHAYFTAAAADNHLRVVMI